MTFEQIITLAVLVGVIVALVHDKHRADVVALAGAAILLAAGAVRPSEVQAAFGSPALITLASLFVIAHAMELSGLLDRVINGMVRWCSKTGAAGIWAMIGLCGAGSAFLNNTPIVVMAAPVVRDVAGSLRLSAKQFLMPLSYVAVLGGCCTLIGTSTNLLVSDMARTSGQPPFSIFEITPVGISVALAGGLYLVLFSKRLVTASHEGADRLPAEVAGHPVSHLDLSGDVIGHPEEFSKAHPFSAYKAAASLAVFVGAIALAAVNLVPIAAAAFAGAVLLILIGVIRPDEAYSGLRPEILMLIAGMVVIGIALEATGLAAKATDWLVGSVEGLNPLLALVLLYGGTLVLTELLSNATVAVLLTPVAVALAESMGVSPRPFLIAVMIAGSAAFATPFGYQTNVLVYQMAGYRYVDFVKLGLPLNLLTWLVAVIAIHWFFPF